MRTVTFSDIIGENGIFIDGDWVESKDQNPNGEIRLIQLADIGDGYFINKSNRFLTTESAEKLKCTFLEPGDILVARMPDPLGRACIFPGLDKPCVTVVDVCIIRPNKEIVSVEWLKFLINSFDFRNTINKFITGTTRQRISRGNLAKLSFKLPPLQEQIRIAEILTQAENLITQRRESIELLDELLRSIFLEMFGDPVRNINGWEKTNVGKYTDCIVPGRDKPKSFTGNTPWIRTDDLNNKSFFESSRENFGLTNEEILKVKGKIIPANSVIMTCVGQLNIISINKVECIINQQLHSFQCHKELNNVFLMYALGFQEKYMYSNASTTTVAYMNKTICNSIPIIIPPLELQNKFFRIVEKVENLKSEYRASLKELENMYGGLSQKAFKGELNLSKVNLELYKEEIKTPVAGSLEPPKEDSKIPQVSKKEIEKFKYISKTKIDITNLSLADYYGIPLDIQAKRENIDFDFVGDDLFYQFLLKDHFKNESFTSQDLFEKLHNHFYHNGNMDFDNEKWKNIIFQFLDANPSLLEQVYDENDNTVKLKLTDEAYKA